MPLNLDSPFDKITEALARPMRKLSDVNLKLLGTKTTVLRIIRSKRSALGDRDLSVDTSLIHNVKIIYPFSYIEYFESKGPDKKLRQEALDIIDILPIEMLMQFEGDEDTEAITLQRGDMIIDVVTDENGELIPILLQITRPRGSFYGKFIISKKCELSLFRGEPETDIAAEIETYLNNLRS